MAQPTNTFDQYDSIGNREHLIDDIYDISPEETPVLSAAERMKAESVFVEWQTDVLAAADANNALIEGDDAVGASLVPTVRVGNRTQIFNKTIVVSGTEDVIRKAGRDSEVDYQVAKGMAEIKRHMEAAVTSNNASVTGSNVAARKLGGLEAWISASAANGTGGTGYVNGGFTGGNVAAATDGTLRAFTETQLKTALQAAYTLGGRPTMLCLGAAQKVVFSSFPGIAETRWNLDGSGKKQATVVGAVDRYQSDFGTINAVVDLFQRNRTALILDPKMLGVAYLRPFRQKKLGDTGDSMKLLLLAEATLCVKNPSAHAKVADLS